MEVYFWQQFHIASYVGDIIKYLAVDHNSPFQNEVTNHSEQHKRDTKSNDIVPKLICLHCNFLQEFIGIPLEKDFQLNCVPKAVRNFNTYL